MKKKFLYIGQYTTGTTSRMRADQLKKLLPNYDFEIIDTNIPFYASNKIARSLGFRYKIGPAVHKVNLYILSNLNGQYDVVWVDKGIYLRKSTTLKLRNAANVLIHFTPDPAFVFHSSRHFLKSLPLYDFVVSTKSYELEHYLKYLKGNKIIMTTQGFEKSIHRSNTLFTNKQRAVVFIGHYEKERGSIVKALDSAGIKITLAGSKWANFLKKNHKLRNIEYLGSGVYGDEYANLISNHMFALGALSKWIPEKHTTRTFEIPACGTALITEENEETVSIFNKDEAIFYRNTDELVARVKYLMERTEELEEITRKGHKKVVNGGYDYESILIQILKKAGI